MATSIDDLLKSALDGIDDQVVPKVTKRTSEEVTTFERLGQDSPKDPPSPPKKKVKTTKKEDPKPDDSKLDKQRKPLTTLRKPTSPRKSIPMNPNPITIIGVHLASYGYPYRRPWKPSWRPYRPYGYGRYDGGRSYH